jgi:hypothetical protein
MLFIVLGLMHCGKPQSGDAMRTIKIHEVVLQVDTDNIVKPDLEPYCSFKGQPSGVSDKDFEIIVNPGDIILWIGEPISSSEDEVLIESINYRGGQGSKDLLGQNVINGSNGVLAAQIIKNAVSGEFEKYAISFKVKNNGVWRNGTFTIDPKLRIY